MQVSNEKQEGHLGENTRSQGKPDILKPRILQEWKAKLTEMHEEKKTTFKKGQNETQMKDDQTLLIMRGLGGKISWLGLGSKATCGGSGFTKGGCQA